MEQADKAKALETTLTQIKKAHGEGAVMKMSERPAMEIEAISTGALALDIALGIGGLPRGRVTEIYGPESSGKTTLALHVVAEAQRNGGICAFIDAEHALDPVYAAAIGIDVDELLISQPDTGEQALEITDMLVHSAAVDVIVIDSVAALTPRAEIEGEMGDAHMGLQARLMSQALRKLTGSLSKTNTICIFINQLREKIGVLFGCFDWNTQILLADGTQEKIGKIVDQKLPVEVLSYDAELDAVVPKKVVSWFDNGETDSFLHFNVDRQIGGPGAKPGFSCTPNHEIRTPAGWREAEELAVGDRVMQAVPHYLSDFQWQVILGSLMGDGALSSSQSGLAGRFRWGHGVKQTEYADWKASLFANIGTSRTTNAKDAVFHDMKPLPELKDLREAVYIEGKKVLSDDYLKRLTPMALAVWYMDDGSFTLRAKGLQERTRDGSGRSEICLEAMEPTTRQRLVDHLADTWDIHGRLSARGKRQVAVLSFPKDETAKLHALIAPFIHPSMEYKLLPRFRGQFSVEPVFAPMRRELMPVRITNIREVQPTQRKHRYDLEIEGTHNYFAGSVMVHNSPETTPGGRALKFYSSVRIDIRRIESIKDGVEVVGNRTRAKVVKCKVAAPFKQAEFDIMYGKGISREGSLLDVGTDLGLVKKSGAWYTYEGEQLGQGRENAKQFLIENAEVMVEVSERVREHVGIGMDDLEPKTDDAVDVADEFTEADEQPITLDD
jgi:recombination protein RecA